MRTTHSEPVTPKLNPSQNQVSIFFRLWKLACLFSLFVSFLTESMIQALIQKLRNPPPEINSKKTANRIADYSNKAMRILGVRTYLLDVPSEIKAGLIVANHLSYLDVLVLSRTTPFLFVTSVEVRNSFSFGLITRLSGALFVEQRTRSQLKTESLNIQGILESQIPMLLFPEGAASDGSRVLPFRSAFFQSAIDAQVPVHLFQLNYDDDAVPHTRDRGFLRYLFELCSFKKIRARVKYLGRLRTESLDRKTLANHAELRIRSAHALGSPTRSSPALTL